jgi:hypothetical protein
MGSYIDRFRGLRVAAVATRKLHISVGCAFKNLLIAPEH